jgi:cell division protein FtsW
MMNRRVDFWLAMLTTVLITFGLMMVYSASSVTASPTGAGPTLKYVVRQVAAIGVGSVLAAGVAFAGTKNLRWLSNTLYGFSICLLFLTLPFGIEVNGAKRWIGAGGINFQPSEFVKLTTLLVAAHTLSERREYIRHVETTLRVLAWTLPPVALLLLQPDFGTAAILMGSVVLLLMIAGIPYEWYILIVTLGASVIGGLVAVAPYRLNRVHTFIDPWQVEADGGHQVIQGFLALHSGGWAGLGLGNGYAKLHYLPEPWTDFIAAVVGEELGFLGLLVLVALFAAWVWRALRISRDARDAYGMYLGATLAALVGIEALLNLGVVLGLVPPKGLVLPFISYGSTAMMSHLVIVGVLLAIAAEARPAPLPAGWLHRKDSTDFSGEGA